MCHTFVQYSCSYEILHAQGDSDLERAAYAYSMRALRARGIQGELIPIGGHWGIDYLTSYFMVDD